MDRSDPPAPSYSYGVNISHYLSQVGDRPFAEEGYITASDMEWIAGRGYDHIRLPIDGPEFLNKDGSVRTDRLPEIDKVLDWAQQHGLSVILDMHKLPGTAFSGDLDASLFTNPELQAQALNLWRVLAGRYRQHGSDLRFEVLNEPVSDDASLVTGFYVKALSVIRTISPDRVVLFCSNRWGRFETVEALVPLLGDPNVVVAVHYYEPHIFTHQGASWVGWDHPDPPKIRFPGSVPDLRPYVSQDHYGYNMGGQVLTVDQVADDFDKLAVWARENGAGLHLGEFGVYEKADSDSRQTWYRTVLEQCRTHGVGWAIWDYKGDFGVRDPLSGQPTEVQLVVDAFLP